MPSSISHLPASPQLPLALKLSARTILVNLESVRAAKGIDAESVIAMVENGRHPEHLKFVFDLSLPGTTRRELRFWTTEIVAPEFAHGPDQEPTTIDQAIAEILGVRETFRRTEIAMQWVCSDTLIGRLIAAREITEFDSRLLAASLKSFLKRRWIGTADKITNQPSTHAARPKMAAVQTA